jgi:hypothetical protein
MHKTMHPRRAQKGLFNKYNSGSFVNSMALNVFPLLALLAGCSAPLAATPPPTPQAVEAAITPALRPLEKALQACAQAHPEIAFFLEETPASAPSAESLAFRFGEPPGEVAFAAAVGREEIVVLLNAANPLSQLSPAHLRDLFGGHLSTWDELGGPSQPIQIWTYPEGDEVRQAFDAAVLQGEAASPQALLAPDPGAMLEAVSAEPGATGYLPRAWLAVEAGKWHVKPARLDPALAAALRRPVLALAAESPQGGAYRFLACLQEDTGRRALEGIYEPWEE